MKLALNLLTGKKQKIESNANSVNASEDEDSDFWNFVDVGRLEDRIRLIREKCIKGLGENVFSRCYKFLKESELEFSEEGSSDFIHKKLKTIFPLSMSDQKIWKYRKMIDQLLWVEENAC